MSNYEYSAPDATPKNVAMYENKAAFSTNSEKFSGFFKHFGSAEQLIDVVVFGDFPVKVFNGKALFGGYSAQIRA